MSQIRRLTPLLTLPLLLGAAFLLTGVRPAPVQAADTCEIAFNLFDANATNAAYSPSLADRQNGSITLTLTTDVPAGPCGAAVDTVSILLTNTPPVANGDTYNVHQGQYIIVTPLTNDSDADNDSLTVTAVTAPGSGSVLLLPNQRVRYTTLHDFNGLDTFGYIIADGHGGFASATVSVSSCWKGCTSARSCAVPVCTSRFRSGSCPLWRACAACEKSMLGRPSARFTPERTAA